MGNIKSSTIYLAREKMWAKIGQKTITAKWTQTTLSSVLKALKDKHGLHEANIILGEDLCYLLILESEKENANEGNILATLRGLIPDEIDKENSTWKIVDKKNSSGNIHVSALIVPKWVLSLLSHAGKNSGVKIKKLVSASSLIGFSTDRDRHASITLWGGYENLAVIARAGTVYASKILTDDVSADVKKLLTFVHSDLDFELGKAVMAGIDNEPTLSPQWKVERKEIDIMAAIETSEKKKSFKTKVVELDMPESPEETATPEKIEPEIKESQEEKPILEPESESENDNSMISGISKKILALLIILPIISALVSGGVVYFIVSNKTETAPVVEEIVEATPTPEPSPEPIDPSDYKVQVLNGSGVTGAAGDAQNVLESGGFDGIDVGNAGTSNETITTVSLKEGASDKVYNTVKDLLKDYSVKRGDDLDEDVDYDVVITLGTK